MKSILLPNGKSTLVDDDVFLKYGSWRWCAKERGYVTGYAPGDSRKKFYLHRLIMGVRKKHVDHINHDPLDNRRENLRAVTRSQNLKNLKAHHDSKSGFKGVSWYVRGKWKARIALNGKEKHIGYFDDKIEAARAYNEAAKRIYGDFAWLNPV